MENDQIKLAFQKVKQDIFYLTQEFSNLKSEINEVKSMLKSLHNDIADQKLREIAQIPYTTIPTHNPTLQHINPTDFVTPTHNPTHPQEIEGLKSPILSISTGNEGVPTDRQTDRQTHQQTHQQTDKSIEFNLKKAQEMLDSLDTLKKEIRLKFKRITNQEMLVFSTIYQLEEQNPDNITYKKVALNLRLSESSIRDYVQRIINKGIPIRKHKLNNKTILLSISPDIKKIATLSTIIQLREL